MSMAVRDGAHGSGTVSGSARPQRLARLLPLAQRALDRGVEGVQAHAEQLGGARLSRGSRSPSQALHQRADERGVLAGDRGGHARRRSASG